MLVLRSARGVEVREGEGGCHRCERTPHDWVEDVVVLPGEDERDLEPRVARFDVEGEDEARAATGGRLVRWQR